MKGSWNYPDSCPRNPAGRVSCSVSQSWLFATPWTVACQASLSFSISWSLFKLMSTESSQWCHPTISSSVIPFSSCLQSFPASRSFLMSHSFASGGQSIGASASAAVLPMSSQDWFPLQLTGLISYQRFQEYGFQESIRNICWLLKGWSVRLTAVRENTCRWSEANFIRLIVEFDSLSHVSEEEQSGENIYRSLESGVVILRLILWSGGTV